MSASARLASELARQEKVRAGLIAKPPEPTKCSQCGYLAAATVCPICKQPRPWLTKAEAAVLVAGAVYFALMLGIVV